MFCDKCGKEIPDDVKFCKYCGNNTEDNVSENKSGSASIGNQAMHKDEHKVKKHKELLIIMIAIAVLALVATLIYLGSRYMMGGEATPEKAIAKSIEALADGDLDAYEKAANKSMINYIYISEDVDRSEFEEEWIVWKWVTGNILGNVRKIDDVYIRDKDALSDEELNNDDDELQALNLKVEKFNYCYEVYITCTDKDGSQLATEYDYYYDEDDEDEYYCDIWTYKIKGRWYAMVMWY